jgi:hypothetical protein
MRLKRPIPSFRPSPTMASPQRIQPHLDFISQATDIIRVTMKGRLEVLLSHYDRRQVESNRLAACDEIQHLV